MGWIQSLITKLQNFLKSKPEIEKIPINELKDWLSNRSKEIISSTNFKVKEYTQKLKEKRWLLECYLDEWSKKISSEPVQRIFKNTREVLEDIVFSNENLGAIIEVNSKLKGRIDELIQEIEETDFSHNFTFLLKEDEKVIVSVNPLLKELVELEGIRDSFERTVTKSGLRKIETIVNKVSKLQDLMTQVEELRFQVQHKKNRLRSTNDIRQQKESELQQLRDDEKYASLKAVEAKRTKLEDSLENQKQTILEFFEDLKPLLEQYGCFEDNGMVKLYLENAYDTLIGDDGLIIIHILRHCKAALLENKFDLNAEEAQTAFAKLRNLEVLKKWQRDDFLFKRELEQLGKRSEEKEFFFKVDEIKYRLNHFMEQEEKIYEETVVVETQENDLSEEISRTKDLLENLISISLNKRIEVVT